MLSLITITFLLMSSLAVLFTALVPANAQQQVGPIPSGEGAERNWEYINHDSWAQNYNPQKDLNKDNIQNLELKWAFSLPSAATFLDRQKGRTASEGSIAPALIADGTTYLLSNMRNTYAFDTGSGKLKWSNIYEKDWPQVA